MHVDSVSVSNLELTSAWRLFGVVIYSEGRVFFAVMARADI